MSDALWATRPRPRAAGSGPVVWQGEPTTLAELRALRMQLRTLLSSEEELPDDVDRLLLAVEELVSNALRHGGSPVRAVITATGSGWLLEVGDAAGDTPPVPAVGRDAALGGLGLYLVAQLSVAHGWSAEGEGRKIVWARIDRTPSDGGPAVAVPPVPGTAPGRNRATTAAPRARVRRAPRRFSVAVTALVLAVTLGLSWLTAVVNAHNSERLLRQQVVQVSTLLTTQLAIIQTQMSDAGQVAVATDGRPGPFERLAAATLGDSGISLSLWRVTGNQVQQLALHGPPPQLPEGGPAPFFGTLQPTGRLSVAGVLQNPEPRLAYALRPPGDTAGLVVYAETPLNRRIQVEAGDAFGGLDLAAYLGPRAVEDQLIQTTAPTPIGGHTATVQVPFANTSFTLVAASRSGMTGPLSTALPWIVLGVGGALALALGATVETLSRRRAVAEGLAADNQRLYQEQRSLAGTLQHALLPEVPSVPGMEVDARYVAGVDELEVGGDWYDVIAGPDGRCVFVVGDVSGQGLPAATTMAALRFAVRAYLAQGDDISTVLTRLRGLLDISVDHQFATVLLGDLDPTSGRIRLVSAGHFAPLLATGGGADLLECPVGPPIGVPAAAPPSVTELQVSGPATLLAFTDGAVERRGEVIDTGLERLRSAAVGSQGQPLPVVLDRLLQTSAVQGGRDDTVILGLRWPGAS